MDETDRALAVFASNLTETIKVAQKLADVASATLALQLETLSLIRDAGLIEEPVILERLRKSQSALEQTQGHGRAASLIGEVAAALIANAPEPEQPTPTRPTEGAPEAVVVRLKDYRKGFERLGPKK